MKYVKQALLRGIIPFIIMSAIALIMKLQNLDENQIRSTFITGLIITSVVAASVIYDVKGWSLAKQSIIHFVVMLITVLPCLLLSGWFSVNGVMDVLKVSGIFMATGFVLWSFMYLLFTKILKTKN